MLINVTASICFFIVICILLLDFYSKETLKNLDNSSFKHLSVVCLIGLLIEFVNYYLVLKGYVAIHSPLSKILGRLIYVYYSVFMYYFIIYAYCTCKKIKQKDDKFNKFELILSILYGIFVILLFVLPFNFADTEDYIYPIGVATDFSYVIGALGILYILFLCVSNYKNLKQQKSIPILWGMIGAVISLIVQYNYHELLLLIPAHAIAIIIMYFTIENPDLKMIEELEIARDQAEKANHAKTDFLSSMSHEIRTPLNAIVGLSEDIGSFADQVPPQVQEDSKDIINASQTLLEIVGNILDISKIESEKLEIIDVDYEPRETFETLAKINLTRKGEKPIDFKMNIADDLPFTLIGDKIRVKQIVNNLLSNSFKYTNQGEVNFTVKCINENGICNLLITVQDTGIGIKKEYIDKLFHKFERLDVERNTTVEGTGLGLAITKKLVEMMGGKINVQSTYGSGSMFFVQLPQKIKDMTNPNPVTSPSRTIAQGTPQTAQGNPEPVIVPSSDNKFAGKKILIVDDNALNIKVAKRALSSFNMVLDECSSGEDSIIKVREGSKYDLILMDIMMPGMGGESALQELKKIEGFNTPVIALTADAISGAKEHYIEVGFNDYIAKPFSRDQIKEKLDAIFPG